MKIKVISDITLDPVIKKIRQSTDKINIDYEYVELLTPYIMQYQPTDADCVLVYCDAFFHLYDKQQTEQLLQALTVLSERTDADIIVSNNIGYDPFGTQLSSLTGRFSVNDKNLQELLSRLQSKTNVYFLDVAAIFTTLGTANAYNYNLGYLYQMPYTKSMIEGLAREIIVQVTALKQPEKKVILLDCDNTLWGGILGEDGVDGVQCDKNVQGIVYFLFQKFLLARKKDGFLLAICSKNNERDVKEAFEKRNMPLKWDDFVIKRINWENKVSNIHQIAEELSLGLDSFVFVDDSEFELNAVKEMIPGITCLKFANKMENLFAIFEHVALKRKFVSEEDLKKTEQYLVEEKRKEIRKTALSIDDYIKSLDIRTEMLMNDVKNIERLSQMTGKTNQFNFNKQHYSPDQLLQYIESGNEVYSISVSDKYGDYGIVGLIMVTHAAGQEAILENYLMSCRALGRRIEYDFYNMVKAELEKRQIQLKQIKFSETAKNAPAQDFYRELQNISQLC